MRIFLTTDRLVLREFAPDDVPLLAEPDGDPAVTRHPTGGRAAPPEEIRNRVLYGMIGAGGRGGIRCGWCPWCRR